MSTEAEKAYNREKTRRYRERYPDRVKASRSRNYDPQKQRAAFLKWKYGLSMEQYKAMATAQNYRCACCGSTDPELIDWCVDHCHETGRIRGLLCFSCNTGIGHLGDSAAGVLAALKYLQPSTELVDEHY